MFRRGIAAFLLTGAAVASSATAAQAVTWHSPRPTQYACLAAQIAWQVQNPGGVVIIDCYRTSSGNWQFVTSP
ncbi:hypothetical protein GCM10009710_30950 [Aeromicrobium alkaliterrae]|uniref:Uncharacterized protein n=1 Tax=Aeromicrobium alkaliterrae TaxID=302168 RepID=A0ABN2K5F8_9ACTN